ncbi:MAG: DNA alkylation repair protein [Candidatus Pacearchaeota archaeon]|nr:DNA alkylation repair protein [Candidatus Pacearchaeota archaeon]
MSLNELKLDLRNFSNPERAEKSKRYFKTGKGQYGEGDVFLGISNPQIRAIAKKYYSKLSLKDIQELLNDKIHEYRLIALIMLVEKYKKAKKDKHKQAEIFEFYLKNKSENLWEKRIAILATFAFIKQRNFGESLFIADSLMNDEHDLIHKAVGWMLREVGKKNMPVLELFLSTRYKNMPRTMLRYAIEKFPEEKRKRYLKGEI